MLVKLTVQEYFGEEFQQMVFTSDSVFINVRGDKILAYGRGIGSNFCIQKGKDHKDSYVFFEITKNGIRQLCSSKELVRGRECKTLCRNCPAKKLPTSRLLSFFPNSPAIKNASLCLAREGGGGTGGGVSHLADVATSAIKARREAGAARKMNVFKTQKMRMPSAK